MRRLHGLLISLIWFDTPLDAPLRASRWLTLGLIGCLCTPVTVHAQRVNALDGAVSRLNSASREDVQNALAELGISGDPRAVAPIAARIRRGLPPRLLEGAIEVLAVLGSQEAGRVLFDLMRHRRPQVRTRAIQAIVLCRPNGADRALLAALDDGTLEVRAAAAQGLAEIGTNQGLDPLFHAFEQGLPDAAMTIAQLARSRDVDRFLDELGRAPFSLMTPPLRRMLDRTDLPAPVRLRIVSRIADLATPQVRAFLETFVDDAPSASTDRVRRAARDAARRIVE